MIAPPWLPVAEREAREGVHELAGDDHSLRVLQYHQVTTLRATTDEVPWCAAFVCWVLSQAGVHHTSSAAARSYLGWGRELEPWAHGAVVVLATSDDAPGRHVERAPGHVGFLIGMPTPSEVLVLGGNQSNAVNVRPYLRRRVLGVRWAA